MAFALGACVFPTSVRYTNPDTGGAGRRPISIVSRTGPLVSVLIPAFNAERWIGDTIRSALAQSWDNTEIIVVVDGATDRTAEIARSFECSKLTVVVKHNEGAAATRNRAYALCQGEYIQWLDADDLLAPTKIERQLRALTDADDSHTLLSAAWAYFAFRPHRARFIASALWEDLSPTEWLLRKMGNNLHMQTATWLTSRALTDAAGPWDERLASDDDGEYFCRVLLASNNVRFVADSKVYYRSIPTEHKVSFIGTSNSKMDAMLLSMKLHIEYLRSLETSRRVDDACVRYLNNWRSAFDPARSDIHTELQLLARALGGQINKNAIRRKYAWIVPVLGAHAAWRVQVAAPHLKARLLCRCEHLLSNLERCLWRLRVH